MSELRVEKGQSPHETTRPDPPVRADGLCAHCHGPRLQRLPKVITQRSRAELIDNLTADPFCSVACCRDYHDTPTTLNLGRPRAALA